MNGNSTPPVVFLHGWGIEKRIYEKLADAASAFCAVRVLDLPGYGCGASTAPSSAEETAELLAPDIPHGGVLVAWSMGALPALHLAAVPGRISALCLIAASPCFRRRKDWREAVLSKEIDAISAELGEDVDACLQWFCALAAHGSPKGVLRRLLCCRSKARPGVLRAGLELLRATDARSVMAAAACPVELILGDADPIVPVKIAAALKRLLPGLKVHIFSSCGHVPFLSHQRQTLQVLGNLAAW